MDKETTGVGKVTDIKKDLPIEIYKGWSVLKLERHLSALKAEIRTADTELAIAALCLGKIVDDEPLSEEEIATIKQGETAAGLDDSAGCEYWLDTPEGEMDSRQCGKLLHKGEKSERYCFVHYSATFEKAAENEKPFSPLAHFPDCQHMTDGAMCRRESEAGTDYCLMHTRETGVPGIDDLDAYPLHELIESIRDGSDVLQKIGAVAKRAGVTCNLVIGLTGAEVEA